MISCIIRSSTLYRGFATHAGLHATLPAVLHLKTGQSFSGRSFGAPKSIFGETVFSTSITSYTESMTDPSYRGQILVFTTPLIGNYGVPRNAAPFDSKDVGVVLESQDIQCSAVVVADVAEKFSHHSAVESLASWCHRSGVPGITGVDTRAITRLLRDQGTTLGRIAVGADALASRPITDQYWDPTTENLVEQVSTRVPYELNAKGDVKIAVLDFGAKANILRSLVRRNAAVTVLPWNFDFDSIRDQYDGLFLSNGPGDPTHCIGVAMKLRRTLRRKLSRLLSALVAPSKSQQKRGAINSQLIRHTVDGREVLVVRLFLLQRKHLDVKFVVSPCSEHFKSIILDSIHQLLAKLYMTETSTARKSTTPDAPGYAPDRACV